MWSQLFDKCQSCGSIEFRHVAKGLCARCYDLAAAKRQRSHITRSLGSHLPTPITKEDLEQKYNSGLSLIDIARQYNCTRQYIHKLMRKHRIVRRSQSDARNLALRQEKLLYSHGGSTGGATKTITMVKRTVNESFFKTWSPAMAWVLGVIYTDGCLATWSPLARKTNIPDGHEGTNAAGTGKLYWMLSLAQKDPEILKKVLAQMESNERIVFTEKRGIAGALYSFRIRNLTICEDLRKLGLTPAKSLTMTFPEMPQDMVRHFIRGCWDGDGSVYWEKRNGMPSASYVSGSKTFVESLERHLADLGLPHSIIYKSMRSKNPTYYIRYRGVACAKLHNLLYRDVDASLYLKRKHDRFKQMAGECSVRLGLEAMKGDTSAQVALAYMYRDGLKVPRLYAGSQVV